MGHLQSISEAHRVHNSFLVLIHGGNQDLIRDLGSHVAWYRCPAMTRHWTGRFLWQFLFLRRLLHRQQVELLISPTGSLSPGISLPQIVLAQNPWCYVSAFHRGPAAHLKAALQRRAYRAAQERAHALFCNSTFLARLYARQTGVRHRTEPILANGVDEAIFSAAIPIAPFSQRALEVLTVSVMTPHKAIEVVIESMALLRDWGIEARLRLVGPWADPSYRRLIELRIAELRLGNLVLIQGHVTDAELHAHYRQARVFCLLSRCESFGLPAVEAQAFGTPSVVADDGAPPDIAGPGGVVVPPDDPSAAAIALQQLLCDPIAWRNASLAARINAERFRWHKVSRPLIDHLEHSSYNECIIAR